MITRREIEEKSDEFGIHVANVQRDDVFGGLLSAIYTDTALKDHLIFKGGNGFRKACFPNSRFSLDLDFSTETSVDESLVVSELNKACRFAQAKSGIVFDIERTQIRLQGENDQKRRVFDARMYFKDFYDNTDHLPQMGALCTRMATDEGVCIEERGSSCPVARESSGWDTVGLRQ